MNEPIIFTMGDIVSLIKAITWLIGSIGVIAGAVMWLWNRLKKPNQTQNARLDALERHMMEVDQRLDEGNAHFGSIDASSRITQRALLALLSHGIDGNSIAPMEKSKAEILEYLTEK